MPCIVVLVWRFTLAWIFVAACSDPRPPEVQFGTYDIVAGEYANHQGMLNVAQMPTLTVAPTADGIAITSASTILEMLPADLPGAGDRYEVEQYTAFKTGCEGGGPYSHCIYSYYGASATVPASGQLYVEQCSAYDSGLHDPCVLTPNCNEVKASQVLAGKIPCAAPSTVYARLATGQ